MPCGRRGWHLSESSSRVAHTERTAHRRARRGPCRGPTHPRGGIDGGKLLPARVRSRGLYYPLRGGLWYGTVACTVYHATTDATTHTPQKAKPRALSVQTVRTSSLMSKLAHLRLRESADAGPGAKLARDTNYHIRSALRELTKIRMSFIYRAKTRHIRAPRFINNVVLSTVPRHTLHR